MKPKLHVVASNADAAARPRLDEIETPSVITPLHRLDRETSKVAGAPRAWRKLTQLENAFEQERLGTKTSNEARDRLTAGKFYTRQWDIAQSAGRDSTQAFDFAGGGQGLPLTEAQRAAISRLVAIEMRLGRGDRTIIRAVCGLGNTPAEAIKLARCGQQRVTERFCEALDSLLDAIECTEKRGRRN